MSRAVGVCVVVAVALLALVAGPSLGQDEGNLASINYWTIKDGATEQFEAGLKAHNKLHADNNDPVPLLTWEVISGPRLGQYGRGSFGHTWADFDQDEDVLAADTADSNIHITPYIEAAEPMIWAVIPEISNPADGPGQITRIYQFDVRPGHAFAFEEAVGKIHAALMKQPSWPAYTWYALVDGGRTPTYVVALPRDNWAGFAPGDKNLMEAMSEEYGDGARDLMQALGAATEAQTSFTIVYRPDLSYLPAGGD